ncbi:aspartate aminotransferase family protein [SAR92 clade bacterium H246]
MAMVETETQSQPRTTVDELNATLQESIARYKERTPKSAAAIAKASEVMPSGLTRNVLQYSPYPFVVEHAEGAKVRCVDGHEYLDYVCDYTAGIYGHSHPVILAAIEKALTSGLSYGAPHHHEMALAAHLVKRFPCFEKVQFANSGTEANIGAIKTARAFTGREAVMVFKGSYHGGVFGFANGQHPDNAPYDFIIGHYNDWEATLAALGDRQSALAAILLDPVMGPGGGMTIEREFLLRLQQLAKDSGALLIFDEVMTSRHGPSGMQGILGVTPDLTSMGKYLGGGFAFGCFGGRAEVMDVFADHSSGARQAINSGTFNNQVMTAQVGLAALTDAYTPDIATAFYKRGTAFRERLNQIIKQYGVRAQALGQGTVMSLHFCTEQIRRPADAHHVRDEARALFYFEMLARGFYTVRRGGIVQSLALTEADDEAFCAAFEDVMVTYGDVLSA